MYSNENNKDRIVVYTAIFGGYDLLLEPRCAPKNIDYVCFTDNVNVKSNIWKIIPLNVERNLSVIKNREIKILAHNYFPQYEYSVYIDGSFLITGDLTDLIKKYLANSNIACPKHPERHDIYEEAKACIELKKAEQEKVERLILRYKKEGYPENHGLTSNGVLLRRHNHPEVIKFMEKWWHEFCTGVHRDQLSFDYVSWKLGIPYASMEEYVGNNSYFQYIGHRVTNGSKIKSKIWDFGIKLSSNKDQNIITKWTYQNAKLLLKLYRFLKS